MNPTPQSVSTHTINASLIICSHNRADQLQKCLASLAAEEMLASCCELILVNNASTDTTDQVMAEYQKQMPFKVVIVNEALPGLGRARNAGIAAARGVTLIFTDDDCYPAAGFIAQASKIFHSVDYRYCGGRILLFDQSDSTYGCNFKKTFELIDPCNFMPAGKIQGANMVIHRDVVNTIGMFDPNLGAGTKFRIEDVDYIARASMAGFYGAHVPELVIYHHHGRKPGRDIEKLEKENDFARGAYYMKMILHKKWLYLKRLLFGIVRTGSIGMHVREMHGALTYLCESNRIAEKKELCGGVEK